MAVKRAQKIQNCSACGGSGECSECNNSGKCDWCEGDPGQCPECGGDGECPECSEWECSVCNGEEICPECRGLGYFESYLRTFEGFLAREATSIQDYLEDVDFFYDQTEKAASERYLENLNNYFPNLFRQSFFVATFSLLETGLKETCEHVHKVCQVASLDEFLDKDRKRRSTLDKFKVYLAKEAKIKFPFSQEWREIKRYNELRNCVMHQQGRLKSDKDGNLRRQYILRQPNLSIISDLIIIHNGYCQDMIKTIHAFFDQLEEAIKARKL